MLADTNELKKIQILAENQYGTDIVCIYFTLHGFFFFLITPWNVIKCYCIPSVPLKKMLMILEACCWVLIDVIVKRQKTNKSTDIFFGSVSFSVPLKSEFIQALKFLSL